MPQRARPGRVRASHPVGGPIDAAGRSLGTDRVEGRYDGVRNPCLARADPAGRAPRRGDRRRAGGLRRRDVFRPLLAVERTAGPVRVRLVVAGRGAAGDDSVRSASSTRRASGTTRRSSRRRSAPSARCTRAGSGRRWAPARPATSTSPAAAGRARRVRNARLLECVDVIRALLAGEEVSRDGLVTVDRARLWTRPEEPPPLIGAAVSTRPPRWCAQWADGLVTVNAPDEHLREMIAAYRDAGGRGPVCLQVHLSWAPDRERGRGDRARPVAQQHLRAAGLLGPGDGRALRRGLRARDGRPGAQVVNVSRRPGPALELAARVRGARASTGSTCTTSARTRCRSSTPSARRCCPHCGEGERYRAPNRR